MDNFWSLHESSGVIVVAAHRYKVRCMIRMLFGVCIWYMKRHVQPNQGHRCVMGVLLFGQSRKFEVIVILRSKYTFRVSWKLNDAKNYTTFGKLCIGRITWYQSHKSLINFISISSRFTKWNVHFIFSDTVCWTAKIAEAFCKRSCPQEMQVIFHKARWHRDLMRLTFYANPTEWNIACLLRGHGFLWLYRMHPPCWPNRL